MHRLPLIALATLTLSLTTSAGSRAIAGDRIPVILATDIGDDIDDTWALALLLRSPELDLRLVVTDYGDTVYRARLVAKLLQVAGRSDVPIGVGLRQRDGGGRQAEWLGDYSLAQYPGRVIEDGVQALLDTVRASQEPMTLIAIGPAPTLRAALDRDPGIAERLRLVGMFGSLREGYAEGSKPEPEWNVKADPVAARTLLGAAWADAIVTPLDTCGRVRIDGERYALVRASKDPLIQALLESYRLWCPRADWCAGDARNVTSQSTTLFDTVAVYLAFGQQLLNVETLGVRVGDDGMTRLAPEARPLAWATSWKDRDAFEDLLAARLSGPPAPAASEATSAGGIPFALRDGDRVVFYGDSITQDGGYARLVEEYVATRFPTWHVAFENAGVGGDTVQGGWAGPVSRRLERDVIAFRPTVVTIMLGMNDGGYRPFDPVRLASFSAGYRAIVDRLRQALPDVRLTIIRPSPFDDVSRMPQFAPGYDDTLRRLGCYAAALAQGPSMASADFRTPLNAGLARLVAADPGLAQLLLPDRIHPSAAGHLVMGATLLRAWNAPALVSRVELDVATKAVVAALRTTVSGLVADGGGFRWTQLDEALPLPLSFDDADVALAQKAGAELEGLASQPLVVRGLAAGRYELRIDGRTIGTLGDGELAKGVNLATLDTPQRRQAYAVRRSVADSHELQRVRRRLMAASDPLGPQTQQAIDALSALDAAARRTRRESAQPKPRPYELVPR